jgi:hypothetical protein
VLKKILPWAILALLLFYIIRNPTGAGVTGQHIWSGITSGASKIAHFLTTLFRGK